ncbi:MULTISPECIES: DUF1998 domain-containing protein [Bacillus cereus group]|uniref:DUF1998 domain-containing protein n=1 Tax=Bacillus cereus group TaxID=86661 RepID=UPI00032E26B2|nr:DUF1998 domain-containing protein [Bacillus cereus]EOQ31957.1 hypothetical protein KQ1_02095 [Bacillus cereus BAG3O-1]PFD76774.1 hypothetical protein CN301_04480 [Bacillus cereus]PFK34378.1 hypothetical protein COJ18_12330 [Bacillus cereus]PFM98419.1 hypothetical protein COJ65_23030 [Bacillus cereus]PFV05680.1 hypothetical protein COL10_23765 [Bacillus cereus]
MGTVMKLYRYTSEEITPSILIERNVQITIEPGKVLYAPLDVGCNKYDIRTIQVTNDSNVEAMLFMYDQKENGNQIYKSLPEKRTYDILNIPCEDKDHTNKVHLYIENRGATTSTFNISLKAIRLN